MLELKLIEKMNQIDSTFEISSNFGKELGKAEIFKTIWLELGCFGPEKRKSLA
jgi:hypothetical protein